MSKLRNYEISLWKDIVVNGVLQEQKICVFGADTLRSQARAIEPKFKRNVNGSNELTFKMYYQYIDNITGEKKDNPYLTDLVNEAKIKLRFKQKWYDLIIKNIAESSSGKMLNFTATDLHINELSKNGFGIILDTKKENSIGTIEELANRVFEDTDWQIDATEKIPQTLEESLIKVHLIGEQSLLAIQLLNENTVAPTINSNNPFVEIPRNATLYLFYSCCKEQKRRLQFIYIPEDEKIIKDSARIIMNKNCQYYIEDVEYINHPLGNKYGLFLPANLTIDSMEISSAYRGKRFVFSEKSLYYKTLDCYVKEYVDQVGNTWYGFEKTEYITPNLIQNFITGNDFKSTTGWLGSYFLISDQDSNKGLNYNAQCMVKTYPDIYDAIINGTHSDSTKYTPYIELFYPPTNNSKSTVKSVVVNSSFYDCRKRFSGFSAGEQYVLYYKLADPLLQPQATENFKVMVASWEYKLNKTGYEYNEYNDSSKIFLTFDSANAFSVNDDSNNSNEAQYKCIIATVPSSYNLTEAEYALTKVQTFITLNDSTGYIRFEDFQIFPYHATNNSRGFLLPTDSAQAAEAKTVYYFFDPNNSINVSATSETEMIFSKFEAMPSDKFKTVMTENAEKINTVNVSKSNYFNICQSLCETFECWADFDIQHDEEGKILQKTIRFKNYIGNNNYAGFRYGVNLKDIQRKLDSKKIVTKLIVPDGINKHAKNGFSTITRAGSNETRENYIYDFNYYINQRLLNSEDINKVFYDTDDAAGGDVSIFINPSYEWDEQEQNCNGYYVRLSLLNKKIDELTELMVATTKPLMEAEAEVQAASTGAEAAQTEYSDNVLAFRQSTGFDYLEITIENNTEETNRRAQLVKNNSVISGYLAKILENKANWTKYTEQLSKANEDVNTYKNYYNALEQEQQDYIKQKKALNKAFFQTYYRFIQEGTWTNNSYIDDEKFFIDAKSVAYTSSMPQVTYTINVIALESLKDYNHFEFNLADKTWMEDEEYFGYDVDGNPYREEVVITEITYALDEIDKDTIKVQNYKNQFQDLFQKITASVQNVNYTSGAWDNAADFTASSDAEKSKYLQQALNYSETVLTNSGEQSVVWDKTGITITDNDLPNQQLRIVAGGIFLRDTDNLGLGWKAGITASGINAKLITTGQLNTGVVQIMNGNEPYFRWDDHGITAYDFIESKTGITSGYNTKRGVRFDRFGIYGYDMMSQSFVVENENIIDGMNWHPKTLSEIENNAQFGLTWNGLFLKLGNAFYNTNGVEQWHRSYAKIGKVNNQIYNVWNQSSGQISFDAASQQEYFVKIFSAGSANSGNYVENFYICDNGLLYANNAYIQGHIHAASGKIGGFNLTKWVNSDGESTDGYVLSVGDYSISGEGANAIINLPQLFFCNNFPDAAASIGGSPKLKNWRLGIGNCFGVTENGAIYCNEGTIARWNLTQNGFYNYVKDENGVKQEIGLSMPINNQSDTNLLYLGTASFGEIPEQNKYYVKGRWEQKSGVFSDLPYPLNYTLPEEAQNGLEIRISGYVTLYSQFYDVYSTIKLKNVRTLIHFNNSGPSGTCPTFVFDKSDIDSLSDEIKTSNYSNTYSLNETTDPDDTEYSFDDIFPNKEFAFSEVTIIPDWFWVWLNQYFTKTEDYDLVINNKGSITCPTLTALNYFECNNIHTEEWREDFLLKSKSFILSDTKNNPSTYFYDLDPTDPRAGTILSFYGGGTDESGRRGFIMFKTTRNKSYLDPGNLVIENSGGRVSISAQGISYNGTFRSWTSLLA